MSNRPPLAQIVVARFIASMDEVATDFPSEEALKKYLEKHPKADKSKHKVVTPDDRAKAKQDKKDQDTRDYQKGLDDSFNGLAKQHGLSRNELAYEFAKAVGIDPREYLDKKVVDKVEQDKKDPDHQLKQKVHKLHSDIDQRAKDTGKTRKQIIEDAVSRGLGMKSAHRGLAPMSDTASKFRHAITANKVATRFVQAMEPTAMEFATPEALQKYLDTHPNADKSKHKVKKDVSYRPKRPDKEVADEVNKMSPKEVADEAAKLTGDSKKRFDTIVEQLSGNQHMPKEKVPQYALLQLRSEENLEKIETERKPKSK